MGEEQQPSEEQHAVDEHGAHHEHHRVTGKNIDKTLRKGNKAVTRAQNTMNLVQKVIGLFRKL